MSLIAPKRQLQPVDVDPDYDSAHARKQRFLLSLLLVVVIVAFYLPVGRNGFVYFDDAPYLLNNPHVQNGINWSTIKWAFTTSYSSNWHPLTWLSHALDYQLFGIYAAGHHYESVVFHSANAVLIFLILEAATGLLWPSLIVAALFGVHPLNVESVAWVAERKNVLSMFFCLLALRSYTQYARTARRSSYVFALIFFALGLMAKPQIITLPFIFLLWDYWPLNRLFPDTASADKQGLRSLIVEKIPLFVLAGGSAAITMVAQRSANSVRTLGEYSLPIRVENCIVAYARYLLDTIWPTKLAPMYPHPGSSLAAWQVGESAIVLALISAFVWKRRDRRYLAMGWLWFLGALVPVIGLIQVGEQAMADRYMYLPLIGIFIAVVWFAWDSVAARNLSKTWVIVPAFAITIVFGSLTYHQVQRWRDGETLWRYTLSVTQRNYMAHSTLAMVLAEQARSDEAIAEFQRAEEFHNYPPKQILSLGAYEQHSGHVESALQQYKKVLDSSTDPTLQAQAWNHIGSAQAQLMHWDSAAQSYEQALRLQPDDPGALVGAALLGQRRGDLDLAITRLSRAMTLAPTDVGLLLLTNAQRQANHEDQAGQSDAQAQAISKDFAQAKQEARQVAASFGVVLK